MDNRITNLVLVNKMSLCKLVFANYKTNEKKEISSQIYKENL